MLPLIINSPEAKLANPNSNAFHTYFIVFSPILNYFRNKKRNLNFDIIIIVNNVQESSSERELRSEVEELRDEVSTLRDTLNEQIGLFADERKRWEEERIKVLIF